MTNVLERFGLVFVGVFEQAGRWFTMFWRTVTWGLRPPFEVREWLRQMVRVAAGIIMLPFLVILGDAIGVYGGYLVAVKLMGTNPVIYVSNTFQFLVVKDLWSGLIKSSIFGMILTLTGCVHGYFTRGGAEGVGRSTTAAVVNASLYILLTDFFLTKLFV